MGWIRQQLDDLEPRADGSGPCGGSIAHSCALFVPCPCSCLTRSKDERVPYELSHRLCVPGSWVSHRFRFELFRSVVSAVLSFSRGCVPAGPPSPVNRLA